MRKHLYVAILAATAIAFSAFSAYSGGALPMWSGNVTYPYYIINNEGAVFHDNISWNSWNMNTPPYYPNVSYVADMEVKPYGGYAILHKDGAIYDSVAGWNLNSSIYYPNTSYAVDLEFKPDGGYIILHRDGAIYDSQTGWVISTPPYYQNVDWAKDIELKPDGDYAILHKDGAILHCINCTGQYVNWTWIVSTPPYYQNTSYAVGLEFEPDGRFQILHKDGYLWDSDTGIYYFNGSGTWHAIPGPAEPPMVDMEFI